MAIVKIAVEVEKKGDGLKATAVELDAVAVAQKKVAAGSKTLEQAFAGFGSNLTNQLSGFGSNLGGLGSTLQALGPAGVAAAAGFGLLAGGIASCVSAASELGGHVSDLAAKTGLSTDAVQAFGYAAQ